jgi:isocitrate dehydrogenase kinase/phosphatase
LKLLSWKKYQVILQNGIADKNTDEFYTNILSVTEEAKSQKVKTPRKSQPWFDQECFDLRQQLNFLKHIFDNFPLNDQLREEKRDIMEIILLLEENIAD